jgi:transposase
MGKVTRKRHMAEFKARVVLEAIKGELTLVEIRTKHCVRLTLMAAWKKAAIDGMVTLFVSRVAGAEAAELAKLYANIGELIMERFFWRKSPADERGAEARAGRS